MVGRAFCAALELRGPVCLPASLLANSAVAGLTVGSRAQAALQAVLCTAPFWLRPVASYEPSPPAKACFRNARPVRGVHCWVNFNSSISGCMFSHLLVWHCITSDTPVQLCASEPAQAGT